MSRYDNKMEFFGGTDKGEYCFTLGEIKLADHLVIIDRKNLTVLEQVVLQAKELLNALDHTVWSSWQTTASFDPQVELLRETLRILEKELS